MASSYSTNDPRFSGDTARGNAAADTFARPASRPAARPTSAGTPGTDNKPGHPAGEYAANDRPLPGETGARKRSQSVDTNRKEGRVALEKPVEPGQPRK